MSFTAWIKGRVVPINSVLGLREILNNITGSGTGGAQTIADVEGLSTALGDLAPKASPAFTGTVDLPAATNVELNNVTLSTILATKQNIGVNPTPAANGTLTLAVFGDYGTVKLSNNANTVLTYNDDLKDGQWRSVLFTDSHAATTVSLAFPTSVGHPNPAYVVALKTIELFFRWHGTAWNTYYTGILA